jgi:hypothetical protein
MTGSTVDIGPEPIVALVPEEMRHDARRHIDDLRQVGWGFIALDVSTVTSGLELVQTLGEAFMFPYSTASPDAAEELMVELSWFENEVGYAVLLTNVDALRKRSREAFDLLVGFLIPNSVWHWRKKSQALDGSFQVYIVADGDTLEACASALSRQIRRIESYDGPVDALGPLFVHL